jgi:hypothetical protein
LFTPIPARRGVLTKRHNFDWFRLGNAIRKLDMEGCNRMTKKECDGEELKDMLRRRREAHERLLQQIENRRTGKNKNLNAMPATPEMEQRLRQISKGRPT